MKTRTLPALVLAFLAGLGQPLTAAPRQLNVRAITMTNDFPGKEVYLHAAGARKAGQKVTVKNFLNHEFDEVALESASFVVTAEADASSAANKEAVIGTFEAGSQIKSCILLFLPGAQSGKGSALMIEDGKSVFPPGATQLVNATKADIKLEIEGKPYEIKAGSRLVIKDQPVGESNASGVKAFTKTASGWAQFSSTTWPHPGTKRVIQIATDGRVSGKPEMRGVKDISAAR